MSDAEVNQGGTAPAKPRLPRRGAPARGGAFARRGSVVLAVLLAILALGLAAWTAYEVYQQKRRGDATSQRHFQLQSRLNNLDSAQQRLRRANAEWQTRIDALAEKQAQDEDTLQEYQDQTNDRISGLQTRVDAHRQAWLLAEIEYLVRLANQRLLRERAPASALQLLAAADHTLAETEGLSSHPLRAALAQDMAALQAVPLLDTHSIYLGLAALIKQVPELKRTRPETPEASSAEALAGEATGGEATVGEALEGEALAGEAFVGVAPEDEFPEPEAPKKGGSLMDTALAGSLGLLRLAGERLADLVDFRRGDVKVKPILPPEEDYYLRQNLIMKLQMAQMGLLTANQEVYQQSLDEAANWVSAGFSASDEATMALLKSLRNYREQTLVSALPEITASLRAAKRLNSGKAGGSADL